MAALYPEDFQGAAPAGVDIICLSSDEEEEMCDLSMTSVLDLQLSSEDEEIDDEIHHDGPMRRDAIIIAHPSTWSSLSTEN